MTYLVSGKVLEVVGAFFLAWVAIRACVIEISIGRHLHQDASATTDLERLREGLRRVLERRRRQFGLVEAILVSAGTSLIAVGCVLYLIGLLTEH